MQQTLRARLAGRFPVRAVGALAGQLTLALSSFVLQVLASRALGPAGFGTFALLFGAIVMATALTTGLLGDSLTVLDRQDPAIRTALSRLSWLVIGTVTTVGFAVALLRLPVGTAALFALAMATFVAADLARRLLMANLRFWSLVVIDSAGLLAMVAFLIGSARMTTPTLDHFLGALAIGQLVAGAVALTRLPITRPKRGAQGWGNWRSVVGYGSWRALQQFIRPTTLNAARAIVLLSAGAAAVGEIEAARVFVAPAMVLVQGFGSYLFSSYAADREQGAKALLHRADRAATIMISGSLVVAAAAAVLLPHIGWLLTADRFQLSMVAVLGWSCYAASCAAILPYGSLAAVRGKQQWVLVIRVVDSAFGLGIAAVLLLTLGAGPSWMPWALSIGSFVGGVLCRQLLLRPEARMVALAGSGVPA